MKKLSFVLAILLVLSLVGCVEQNTPTTTPTEEVDVIWNKIRTAVNECNSKECLHATLHLTNEDIHEIDWNTAPKVNEHWICGQTHYVEMYSQGEKKPHSLEHKGTFYLPGGENQWLMFGENTDGLDVAIDLPAGKDAIVDWTEVDGQLEVVLENGGTLCLDADGMLLWYSETTEGYTVDGDGQPISAKLRWILLYNDTPEQQIRQTVETVIANMEIIEPETEATAEPTTKPTTEPTEPEKTVPASHIAYYYDFTADEIAAAREAALEYTRQIDPDPDSHIQYHVYSIAYDPELTDLIMYWRYEYEDRFYRDKYMAFSVFYRGTKDLGDGATQNYEDTGYILCFRETAESPWTVEEYSETGGDPTALPAEYLPAFGVDSEIVAGYTQGIDGMKIIARYELYDDYYRSLAYTLEPDLLLPVGTELTEDELQQFADLLSIYVTEDPWFNYALTSEYADPADVDLLGLLYNTGVEELTQEDRDFAAQNGLIPEILNKYPASMIDAQLQRLFGITLDETNGVGLEKMAYNPETDSYYHSHGGGKASHHTVLKAIRMPSGDVAVYYEVQQKVGLNPAQDQMVVVLRPDGDSYRILMNVRAGLGYERKDRTEPLPEGYSLADLVTPITKDLEWKDAEWRDGVSRFSIPNIYPFSPDAVQVRQMIQEYYLRRYHENFTYYEANHNAISELAPSYLEICYEASLNGNILSVMIFEDWFTDSYAYRTYNFNVETGELLDTADLLEALGISRSDYEELLGGLVSKAFTDQYGDNWEEDKAYSDLYYSQKEKNDSPENIAAAKPYVDADGNLWAICNVYSLAGASCYATVFSLAELTQ